MLMFKSTHTALLKAEARRCTDLLAQKDELIAELRKLVFIPVATHEALLPARTANAVLDSLDVQPQLTAEMENDLAEANRIISGDYDRAEDSW